MRILLVEDDELIGSGLEAALHSAGFAIDWARDGDHAKLSLLTTRYELMILDLGLPGLPGMELLVSIRARGDNTPVLVLTARDAPAHRVFGLDAGADDFVGKPFDLSEVISRCRALIRRAQNRTSELLVWRDLIVSPLSHTAIRNGERVQLTAREFAVLVHLLTNLGRPQQKARIEESLYGWGEQIESNAIEVYVSNLRKKLGIDAIVTVRGAGYVMGDA